MHKMLKTSLILAAFVPSMALAQAESGDREITINGSGSSDKDFDTTGFDMNASYGQYINDAGQVGVRQSLSISDTEGESTDIDGATVLFYDHHFDVGERARPFVGLNVGYNYGDRTEETFSAGPEAGLKYYVRNKTFIQGMVQYQFLFDSADEAENNYDDGIVYYSVGVGYNF